MDRQCYQRRYREAMFKALTAQSDTVRAAYYDLANFYQDKLGDTQPARQAA